MSTVISDSLVLTEEGVMNPQLGRLCWNNILRTAEVSITSETDLHPASNLLNPATAFYWQASSTAQQDIEVTVESEIDYIGFVRHNFSVGSEIRVVCTIGSMDITLYDWRPTPSKQVQLYLFNRWHMDTLTISVRNNTEPLLLGVMYAGLSTILQRPIYSGHTPITYGRNLVTVGGYSENGQYLGELVRREGRNTQVALENLTPSWYREYLDPFIAQRPRYPAFYAWRPRTYSAEVGYVWLVGSPRPVNQRGNGMMQITMDFEGIT